MLLLYHLDTKDWKRWDTLAAECQRRLAEQQIAPGNPGSILKDVEQLLEFVGPKGILTKGQYANWPPAALRVNTFDNLGLLPPYNLFLQQQFGLTELQPRPLQAAERKNWCGYGWLIGAVKLTAWGTAVTEALLDCLREEMGEALESSDSDPDAREQQLELGDKASPPSERRLPGGQNGDASDSAAGEDTAALEEEPDESDLMQEFGMLQPVFQPCFPEWKTVYERPNRGARPGTCIFKVALTGWRGEGGGIWRRLAVPSHVSLDDLAVAIIRAFKFDNDHLYDFRYRDERGITHVYNHPEMNEGPFTSEITVGETELALEDKMLFTFDYGDDWQFDVLLERIDRGAGRFRRPKVIKSAGKAPKQYADPDYNDSGW